MDNILNILEIIISGAAATGIIFGIIKWIWGLNKNVNEILKEVKPNSGKSLRDQVVNIQNQVVDIQQQTKKNSDVIHTICSRQKWLLDNREEPIFECDENGLCTWVNEKYCQLLQHDVAYFLGNGWKNAVHSVDLDRVEKEWNKAMSDKRGNISEYRIIDREGKVYKIRSTSIRNEGYGYIGNIKILE